MKIQINIQQSVNYFQNYELVLLENDGYNVLARKSFNIELEDTQVMSLNKGWHLLSSYYDDVNLKDNVNIIPEPTDNENLITIQQDPKFARFYPNSNDGWFEEGGLIDLDEDRSFWININNNLDLEKLDLHITGDLSTKNSVELKEGWNTMRYPLKTNTPLEDLDGENSDFILDPNSGKFARYYTQSPPTIPKDGWVPEGGLLELEKGVGYHYKSATKKVFFF